MLLFCFRVQLKSEKQELLPSIKERPRCIEQQLTSTYDWLWMRLACYVNNSSGRLFLLAGHVLHLLAQFKQASEQTSLCDECGACSAAIN